MLQSVQVQKHGTSQFSVIDILELIPISDLSYKPTTATQ